MTGVQTCALPIFVRYDPDQLLSDMVEYDGILYLAGQVGEDTKVGMKEQT